MSSLEESMKRIDAISANMDSHGVGITAPIIMELIKQAHREFMKDQRPISMPDFSEPRFNTPNVVYSIQNTQNRKVYIGKTTKSFCQRYPEGRWWKETENKDLFHDIAKYGYANYNVNIYLCDSKEQMDQMEATLINVNWAIRYNRQPEPEVK